MSLNRRSLLKGLFACPACAAATEAFASSWTYENAAEWGAHDEAAKACAVG